MLGAIGGVTIIAMILCKDSLKGPVLLFWGLFVVAAMLHTHGVPL